MTLPDAIRKVGAKGRGRIPGGAEFETDYLGRVSFSQSLTFEDIDSDKWEVVESELVIEKGDIVEGPCDSERCEVLYAEPPWGRYSLQHYTRRWCVCDEIDRKRPIHQDDLTLIRKGPKVETYRDVRDMHFVIEDDEVFVKGPFKLMTLIPEGGSDG